MNESAKSTKAKMMNEVKKVDSEMENAEDKARAEAESAKENMKKIWLAALGVYADAYDRVSERYDQLRESANETVHHLISRGKEVEDQGEKKINETQEKTSNVLHDRMNKVRETFFGKISGEQMMPEEKIGEVTKRLDDVSDKLDALRSELADKFKMSKSGGGEHQTGKVADSRDTKKMHEREEAHT